MLTLAPSNIGNEVRPLPHEHLRGKPVGLHIQEKTVNELKEFRWEKKKRGKSSYKKHRPQSQAEQFKDNLVYTFSVSAKDIP